jgi:flagellar motor switch protein FliG
MSPSPSTALATTNDDDRSSAADLSGVRKVAVLLMSLGPERASTLLREFDDQDIEAVLVEITQMEDLDHEIVDEVVEDFARSATDRRGMVEGGLPYARRLLEVCVGGTGADAMLDRLVAAPRFAFLDSLKPAELVSFLAEEHPQAIAVVLAHLTPDRAARVLGGLDEAVQREVAVRIATMDRTNPAAIDAIEAALSRKTDELQAAAEIDTVGGVEHLIALLSRSEKTVEKAVVEELELVDAEMAEEVRAKLFRFEDIVSLEDRSVQLVLRQVDTRGLAVALKGASDEVSSKVFTNMSARAAENLEEEISLLGNIRNKEVNEARTNVVKVIRQLEDSGDIVIDRGLDDDDE